MNEEETLPLVLKNMPKRIDGVDEIVYQIIDDGSTDNTVKVAKDLGVHHILTSSPEGKNRRWLGRAFKVGLDHAIKIGADILVNTDGDNQYPSESIPDLVKPILEKKAHIVIGDRQTHLISEFSAIKKLLQKIGSRATSILSGGEVKDAVSGFRAYSLNAMLKINVITDYTYTVDTIMQAEKKGLDIEWVKIGVNKKTRESRLIKNTWSKIKKSGATILRLYAVYEPFKVFMMASVLSGTIGLGFIGRYGWFYVNGSGDGHIQSVVLGGVLVLLSMQLFALGIVADLMSVNRRLTEDLLYQIKLILLRKDED